MARDELPSSPVPDLTLSDGIREECVRLMRAADPREACALFVGERTKRGHEVTRLVAVRNLAEDEDAFQLDPLSLRSAEQEAREEGLDVLGLWHSHPRAAAAPSPRDRAGAQPGWSHAISGASDPRSIRSYFLCGGRLVAQEVISSAPVA